MGQPRAAVPTWINGSPASIPHDVICSQPSTAMQKLEEARAIQVAAPLASLPVSVIVPARNEASNLPRCLESLRGVGEVYVVDSQSSDGTCGDRTLFRRQGSPVPLRRRLAQEAPVGDGYASARL